MQFHAPGGAGADYFTDFDQSFYWFAIDNQVANEGSLDSYRLDGEYDLEMGPLERVRFGARWTDRNRVTRSSNFSNWGNLSIPWTGNPALAGEVPFSQVRTPFDNFQRGNAPVPVPGGAGIFYGGDNLVQDYLSGVVEQQADDIRQVGDFADFAPYNPIYLRSGLVPGTVFLPGEISDVDESTEAYYARLDFTDGEPVRRYPSGRRQYRASLCRNHGRGGRSA